METRPSLAGRAVLRMSAIALALLCASFPACAAGRLAFGAAQTGSETIQIPIILQLDEGTAVSSLDFALSYDPAMLKWTSLEIGESAAQSGKAVDANADAPGRAVAVVAGINQKPLLAGVIAMLQLQIAQGAPEGSTTLAISDTTFTSPEAQEVPSEGGRTTLEITYPPKKDGQGGSDIGVVRQPDAAPPAQAPTPVVEQGSQDEAGKSAPDVAGALEEARRLREGIDTPESTQAGAKEPADSSLSRAEMDPGNPEGTPEPASSLAEPGVKRAGGNEDNTAPPAISEESPSQHRRRIVLGIAGMTVGFVLLAFLWFTRRWFFS